MSKSKTELIAALCSVFHRYGYDGATLSRIAEATGLGKGSLYHHFPDGKVDMAVAVLQAQGEWFHAALDALRRPGEPAERIAAFAAHLRLDAGRRQEASTLDVYTMGDACALFRIEMGLAVQQWLSALQGVIEEAGLPAALAGERAAEAIALLEGTRLMCRCLDDWRRYETLLDTLPQVLLKP
ncbi:TetR/AcrR family transcriptional regulator [Chitiniphilus purpureus]|uniref:TetR/AcrR family transcriptional regulator n=1 Tax=Chitiniphilus purpureus TaxID=2981137 RepID=A0ABY6DTW0_9NEIS|nr:TetR/AcrR family transcriptional regulator [Chitiniphilus sp. CD1]UXY16931.1 TetR/AcrR family transcriptional regulator [Chitiniphilus sp. CD1]